MTSRQHRDTEERRKIRESCNTCSSQKIRCGKQRPSCSRCVTKGLECNYSYSQRTGRRASIRVKNTASTTATTPTSPIMGDNDHVLGSMSLAMTPPMPGMMVHSADTFSFDAPQDSLSNGFADADKLFQDFDTDMSLDFLWPPKTATTASCTTLGNLARTVTAMQDIGPLGASSQANAAEWQSVQSTASAAGAEPSTSPTTPDFTGAQEQVTLPARYPARRYHSHDCMALALQVVDDLHISRELCTTAASDPMSCTQTSKDDLVDVDSVLFLNRDAIKTVNRILDCPCSADQSVALACYLAAAKIVYWYGAAMGIAMDGFQEDGNSNASNSPLSDEVYLRPMSDRIVARPILMGRYCLDADTQRAVLAKVILSELREHIQPLMDRLPRYQVSHPNGSFLVSEHGGSRPSTMSKDGGGMACALRSQLRKIIRAAGNITKNP